MNSLDGFSWRGGCTYIICSAVFVILIEISLMCVKYGQRFTPQHRDLVVLAQYVFVSHRVLELYL